MRYLSIFCFLIYSCSGNQTVNPSDYLDSIKEAKRFDSFYAQRIYELAENNIKTKDSCPITIVSEEVHNKQTKFIEAKLRIKNTSGKDLDGIKIGIYCYNNFDEPASIEPIDNYITGISQDILKSGNEEVYTWELSSFPQATKIKSFIREIHFTDGSKWNFEKLVSKN